VTHETAMAYLDLLPARLAQIDEAILSVYRQSIRGCVFLMIVDPTHREEAIIAAHAAHAAGQLTLETLRTDLLKAIQPWIPTKKATNEK
jgi:hypothetical protein